MKKTLLGTVATVALALPLAAQAADLPAAPAYKAPIMAPAPVYSWTGFYIGVNAGAAINDSDYNLFPTGCFLTNVACGGGPPNNPLRSDSHKFNGVSFTGGGQAGYNWQMGMTVWGIEADLNWKGENETDSINRPVLPPLVGNFIHSTTDQLDWFGTVRARGGFLATPSLLIYATGGLAYGHVNSATSVAFTSTTDAYAGSISTTRAGWTAGAGAEWMFAPGWSAKAEYLFVDLGTASYTSACVTAVCGAFVPPPSYQTDLRVRDNIFRAGLNYHFNWGGPVVARY
jgi:outer membrane immunogenic protein